MKTYNDSVHRARNVGLAGNDFAATTFELEADSRTSRTQNTLPRLTQQRGGHRRGQHTIARWNAERLQALNMVGGGVVGAVRDEENLPT
jgi:hypothetical protein